jgi:hypothetical protein
VLVPVTPICAQRPAATAPTTSASEVKMIYTLGDDNNEKLAQNPTVEQIKAAVASLDGDKVQAVYLKRDDAHAIQANWIAKNELSFQYQNGGDQMHHTPEKYSPDVAVKLLQSYMSDKDQWLKMVKWEPEK